MRQAILGIKIFRCLKHFLKRSFLVDLDPFRNQALVILYIFTINFRLTLFYYFLIRIQIYSTHFSLISRTFQQPISKFILLTFHYDPLR